MDNTIKKYCLYNAIKYGGKASKGSVIAYIIGQNQSYKKNIKELMPEIEKCVRQVNALAPESQIEALRKIDKSLLEKEKKVQERVLPRLDGAEEHKVVLRIAPYPSGPLHIGNARQVVVNDEYAKMYKGKLLLVMDDTIGSEEKTITKEAYDLIVEGCKWLKADFDRKVIYKSDRLEIYYKYIEELIKKDKTYVCFCSSEKIRANRKIGKNCDCRYSSPLKTKEEWKSMLKGEYKEGEAVLRIKTDMKHPNPAFRDRVLFRISKREHPRVGNKYHVWPLLEFSWAIDDHLLGVTHVIRGKDLMMETDMENYIWKIFGWKGPVIKHTGLVQIEDVKLSKSKSKKEATEGTYAGWDDPRTWSLQSLSRRGILPKAVREFVLDLGVNANEVVVPIDKLYSANRKLIEERANRYFLVVDPVEISINKLPPLEVEMNMHPDYPKRGKRKFNTKNKFYIQKEDREKLSRGKLNRLMSCCNFTKTWTGYECGSYNKEKFKESKDKGIIMHYLPKQKSMVKFEVLMPDGSTKKGYCEDAVKKVIVDEVIQAERLGYMRLDDIDKGVYKFWYTHK